ncbi:TPA: acyltransferase family protein [Enterococcus faecium]
MVVNRKSNFELLRILCIVLIVAGHYSYWGFDRNYSDLTLNRVWLELLLIGRRVAVNCFVLITGFFMCNSDFNYSKVLKKVGKIAFQVEVYSICLGVILYFWGKIPVTPIGILQ